MLVVLLLLCTACSSGTGEKDAIETPSAGADPGQSPEEKLGTDPENKRPNGDAAAELDLSFDTIADLLSADLWDYEENELQDCLLDSGWTAYSLRNAAGHVYRKEINGYPMALSFSAFDSGKIKALSLDTVVHTEEKQPQLTEKMQNVSASDWDDARMIVLMPEDTDFISLCAQWILESRGAIQAANGTLTEGAMRFSGEREDEISAAIRSLFQIEGPDEIGQNGAITEVGVGEGYFLLPDGSHAQATAAVNPTAKTAKLSLIRYHKEWVDFLGQKPQPSTPDYRPNHVDGYLTITRRQEASE